MSSCQSVELLYPGQAVEVFPNSLIVTLTAIVGFLIGLLVTVPFVKDLSKRQVRKTKKHFGESDHRPVIHNWDGVEEDGVHFVGGGARETTAIYRKMQKQKKKGVPEEDTVSYTDEMRDMATESPQGGGLPSISFTGIISILTRSGQSSKSRDKALEELSVQDIRDTWTLQTETQIEKSSVFVLLLQNLLMKFVTSEKLEEEYVKEFILQYKQTIEEREEEVMTELTEIEKKLEKSGKSGLEIEEELEMKRPEYSRKMAGVLESCNAEMREELQLNSGLNEEQVEAIYEKLHKYMTSTEKMIGQSVDEQSVVLQDRLAKRQALSQQYADLSARESKETQTKLSEMRNILTYGVNSQKMTHEQMERIFKDYEENLEASNERYKRELERQSRDLMKKLRNHREAALAKLKDKQAKEKEKLEQSTPMVVNPADVVQAHHDLCQQHRTEKNDMIDELDYSEAQALSVLRKRLTEECKEETDGLLAKMVESLADETELSEKEAKRMMRKYLDDCAASQELLAKEKEKQSEMLQRRLAERKAAWEKEREKQRVEQEQLTRQQDNTVTKVLDSQAALDEEARKRIMMQHKQNMVALENHLQMTRMRQQKLVEAKLAKRRAKIEAIRQQQLEEAAEADQAGGVEERHDEELAAEISEYKAEERKMLEVFRSKMVIETSEMLKAQDEKMGWLLGKLQVGQARRRNIIERQDKTIQELQEKLVDTVGDSNRVPEQKTEQIIAKHLREVEEVENKLRQAREHQARVLQQKYETQKMIRERTILAKHEENKAKQETAESKPSIGKKRKMRATLEVLSKIYEDSKQEQALRQMEQEMRSEMLKQKQEINRELEEAMQKELEEREKDFLGDLAAISELRKEELTDLVAAAVEDSGGDQSEANLIKKDLIKRIKKARSDPEESSAEQTPRKKKKGKGKK